jgi:hypothetical protein
MKLINKVNAYITAEAMSGEVWSYDLALALVKVKAAVKEDAAFFIEEEQKLVKLFADLNEDGSIRLGKNGTFTFKDPARVGEYGRLRTELCNTDAGEAPGVITVKPPAEIKPGYIEALTGFIEFA